MARQGFTRGRPPIGVLLAGGEGRRVGGDKAKLGLAGRPLAHYALDALTTELEDVVVACHADTELPQMPGVSEVWVETGGPRSPLRGVICALREAKNRAIVVCSLSLPLVTPRHVRALVNAEAQGRPAVMLACDGKAEPLLARYGPTALPLLESLPPHAHLDRTIEVLRPTLIDLSEADPVFLHVEVPEDVLRAQSALDARRKAAVAHA